MAEDEIVVEEEDSLEVTPPSHLMSSTLPSLVVEEDDDDMKLKHLEFIQVSAAYFVVCFSRIYELAKDNSGPLKIGVENIEAVVKTVLSPVYDRFSDVPFKLLQFVDRKVDDLLFDTTKSVARSVREKYEPVAEHYAATVWRLLNQVPLFTEIAHLVIPTAFYWSEKYNDAVRYVGDRDYYVADYLPMIPIEKITDILEQDQCRSG